MICANANTPPVVNDVWFVQYNNSSKNAIAGKGVKTRKKLSAGRKIARQFIC